MLPLGSTKAHALVSLIFLLVSLYALGASGYVSSHCHVKSRPVAHGPTSRWVCHAQQDPVHAVWKGSRKEFVFGAAAGLILASGAHPSPVTAVGQVLCAKPSILLDMTSHEQIICVYTWKKYMCLSSSKCESPFIWW